MWRRVCVCALFSIIANFHHLLRCRPSNDRRGNFLPKVFPRGRKCIIMFRRMGYFGSKFYMCYMTWRLQRWKSLRSVQAGRSKLFPVQKFTWQEGYRLFGKELVRCKACLRASDPLALWRSEKQRACRPGGNLQPWTRFRLFIASIITSQDGTTTLDAVHTAPSGGDATDV